MSNDKQTDEALAKTGQPDHDVRPEDHSRKIDLKDEHSARQLAERLKVTPAHLAEAVSAVGPDVHAVETYLRGQGGGV